MRARWQGAGAAGAVMGLLAVAALHHTTAHPGAAGQAFRFIDVAPDAGLTRVLHAGIITVGPSRWILTAFDCEERRVVSFSAMANLSGR